MELFLSNEMKTQIYQPIVEEGIEWSTERRGAPGKLVFKVIKDHILDFSEGSLVRFTAHGKHVFCGYVFKQQRSKDHIITVTAYDQMRYLKNKDTLKYVGITATQFIQNIATNCKMTTGTMDDTKYIIPTRVEENKSYSEMIETALDLTWGNGKETYILYDDFGRLTLKNIENMLVGESNAYLMIDEETGENFDYTSSIEDNTFNTIKLVYDSEKSGGLDPYVCQDSTTVHKWGVLQYLDTVKEGENGAAKAQNLLDKYNKKTRNLKITNAIGDSRVRGGSMVVVKIDLGDLKISNFMLVEHVKHTFKGSEHWMDLTLKGGEISV